MTVAGPYTDENGVFKNKLGLTTEAELQAVEYAFTSNRAEELVSGRTGLSVSGYGLARQQAIHKHLFQDVYEWAGQTRTTPSRKRADNGLLSIFAAPDTIAAGWQALEEKTEAFVSVQGLGFEQKREALADIFIEANRLHAFPEGNGRSLQVFRKQLAREQGVDLDYSKVNATEWNLACAVSGKHGRLFEHVHLIEQPPNAAPIQKIFADIAKGLQYKPFSASLRSMRVVQRLIRPVPPPVVPRRLRPLLRPQACAAVARLLLQRRQVRARAGVGRVHPGQARAHLGRGNVGVCAAHMGHRAAVAVLLDRLQCGPLLEAQPRQVLPRLLAKGLA